jgi:hypothetical protein
MSRRLRGPVIGLDSMERYAAWINDKVIESLLIEMLSALAEALREPMSSDEAADLVEGFAGSGFGDGTRSQHDSDRTVM